MERFVLITPDELERLIIEAVAKAIPQGLQKSQPPESDKFLNISETAELLRLSKPTIYGLVAHRAVPFMKRRQRLYFDRNELIKWLRDGRHSTIEEIESSAMQSLKK
jgi:excisionase family DNA binding protein